VIREHHRIRPRYGRAAIVRAALIVFTLALALTIAVVYTLDRGARRSNMQQAQTELAGAARVSASEFAALRADLRARAGELASSLELQRALIRGNRQRLVDLARERQARISVGKRSFDWLPKGPTASASATIADGGNALARVTVAIPLDHALVSLLERATPLPEHAALLILRDGRVVAGGPVGARVHIRPGSRVVFGEAATVFVGKSVTLEGGSILAVEPVAAIEARVVPYRRRLFLAAALSLALAAGMATRLARPVARVLADAARLARQAQTDSLTGLANRRALDERLDGEVEHARSLGTNLSFVLADLDNFKEINDRYGHQAGDAVLRAVAGIFERSVRELDLAARYGGEELALVLPGTQLAGARRLAERIRKEIQELSIRTGDGEVVRVTSSFGAASFPGCDSVEALVRAADDALYDAKRNGKNVVETATARKRAASRRAGGSTSSVQL
jgi:diguanylate cyclase (GGDEF)-like protein